MFAHLQTRLKKASRWLPVALLPFAAHAQANDNCATATALTVGATCTPTTTTNAGATASTGAPTPSATGCFLPNTPISNDVWYTVVVPTGGALSVTTSEVASSDVFDTGLIVYSGTCGTLTEVACSDDANSSDFFSSAVLRGQTPGSTLYVRVWSFGTSPAGQFGICATALPATDAAVTAIYSLGSVATSFSSPVTAQAVVTNTGSTALANLPVTLAVSGATTFTNMQTVASLAPGASATVTFSYPVTATSGTNTLTVTVPNDGLAANNTETFTQAVSASKLSYVSGNTFEGGAGLTVAGSVIATGYRTARAATISSVTPYFAGTGTAGSTYEVLIYNAAANGQPGTVLYTSPARPRPAGAAGIVTSDPVSIPGVAVNGAFFVGIRAVSADNLGVAYQAEAPLRGGTFFFTTNGGTSWTDINTSTLDSRLAVDVFLGVVTATRNEALAATVGLYPNPAHHTFRLDVPAGRLHAASATLLNAMGQVVQTRQLRLPAAGGPADFDVSALAPGVYSLRLTTGTDLVVKRVVIE